MGRVLLSYEDAIRVVRSSVALASLTEQVALDAAVGRVLAEPLTATDSNPRFDNSAVDGYAIGSAEDRVTGTRLKLEALISAGAEATSVIQRGTAVRIFTGAPVPPGTFGIVMQEDVSLHGGEVELGSDIAEGDFIRRRGADFHVGELLLPSRTRIHASNIPLLAFCGAELPIVYRLPRVTILSTGDELVSISDQPVGAQIRDTNGPMLSAMVAATLGRGAVVNRVKDDYPSILNAIQAASRDSDLVILSGGASVGDKDYVGRAVDELGEVLFHGVKIRPGKPTLLGRVGSAILFGLPGNPASSFVCFELFVREALMRLMGAEEQPVKWLPVRLGMDHDAMGREDFVRGRLENDQVVSSGEQGSFGIVSPGRAEFLVRFPADRNVLAGEMGMAAILK